MPPVPVHIDDPIAPVKPQGTTPQTSEQQNETSPANNNTTNAALNQSPAYPPARPGAAAVPAPTPYIPRPPPAPTQTQPSLNAQNIPPPPQPGAVPVPPSQYAPPTTTSTLPPPPKAGEALKQPRQSIPNQMQVPPPQQNYAPTHSTSNYIPPTAAPGAGPTTLNLGRVGGAEPQSEHPPGYHQNAYAQDMTPAQRASLDQQERRESVLGTLGGDSAGEAAGDVWNTVKGWASAAGEKLIETEEAVWKAVNRR